MVSVSALRTSTSTFSLLSNPNRCRGASDDLDRARTDVVEKECNEGSCCNCNLGCVSVGIDETVFIPGENPYVVAANMCAPIMKLDACLIVMTLNFLYFLLYCDTLLRLWKGCFVLVLVLVLLDGIYLGFKNTDELGER